MGARGVLRVAEGGRLLFWCPGCKEAHVVGPNWSFDGNYERPTFAPSIKVTGSQIERDEHGKWTGEWVLGPDGKPLPQVCHSFVREGQIQFLGDCTHALAGQTVPLAVFNADQEAD